MKVRKLRNFSGNEDEGGRLEGRQSDRERAALVGDTLNRYLSMVLVDDPARNRQSQAAAILRAGVGRAVEALEDMLQIRPGDSPAGVRDGDAVGPTFG